MGSLTHIPVASCPRWRQPPFQLFLPFSPLSLSTSSSLTRANCFASVLVASPRRARLDVALLLGNWPPSGSADHGSVLLYSRIDVTSRLFSASEGSLEQVLASFLNGFSTGAKKLALVTLCVSLDLCSLPCGFL